MNGAPLITAVRGPVMLMALGGLFLADRFHGIEIGRTWPALIILYGVMKLAERLLRGPRRSFQS